MYVYANLNKEYFTHCRRLATAIAVLHGYFTPKVNDVVEQHIFRKRVQLADESTIQYVTALRRLVATLLAVIRAERFQEKIELRFFWQILRFRFSSRFSSNQASVQYSQCTVIFTNMT